MSLPHCSSRGWPQIWLHLLYFAFPGFTHAALPAYFFADFEPSAAWSFGKLPPEKAGLATIQGEAAVVANREVDSSQTLELSPSTPFTAVFVETKMVAKAPVVFCEMLIQMPAAESDEEAEFLNFGGAVVGFFRQEKRGELRVLFSRSAEESVWISSGQTFALDETGRSVGWLRLAIRLDRRTERWSLRINDVEVLNGLRAQPGEAAGLPLWLYGHAMRATQVDDLLITTVAPEDLEKMIEWQRLRAARGRVPAPGAEGAKLVTRALNAQGLRSAQPAIREATAQLVKPVLRAWDMFLEIGDSTFKSGPQTEIEGRKSSLLVYSPRFDESGQPLPGLLTITADAELRPGVDLTRLRWLIAEIKKWPDELGETVAAGDFRTGLVQTATIPPDAIRKATTVQVWVPPGSSDVRWWRFRRGESSPAKSSSSGR